MKVKFLDGSIKEFANGSSPLEIANSISVSLAKKSVLAKINGQLWDLKRPINSEDIVEFELLLKDSKEAYEVLNHSCAHLLATAVNFS